MKKIEHEQWAIFPKHMVGLSLYLHIFYIYRLASLIQTASLLWIDLLVLLFFVTLLGSRSHHLLISIARPMPHVNMHIILYVCVHKIQRADAVV